MLNKKNDHEKKLIELKPYNVKELAIIYGVDRRTMKGWLKLHESAIGIKPGRYFTVLQVKTIFQRLGIPSQVQIIDWQPD